MNKLRAIVAGGLVAGTLIASAVPALADGWFWSRRDTRWGDTRWRDRDYHCCAPGYTRRDFDYYRNDLARNRYELDRDLRNGAGSREIARDRQAIQTDLEILRRIR
jgi:hypothetical protein